MKLHHKIEITEDEFPWENNGICQNCGLKLSKFIDGDEYIKTDKTKKIRKLSHPLEHFIIRAAMKDDGVEYKKGGIQDYVDAHCGIMDNCACLDCFRLFELECGKKQNPGSAIGFTKNNQIPENKICPFCKSNNIKTYSELTISRTKMAARLKCPKCKQNEIYYEWIEHFMTI